MKHIEIKDKRIVGVYLTSYFEIEQVLENDEKFITKINIETKDNLEEKIRILLELKYLSIPVDTKELRLNFDNLLETKLQNRGFNARINLDDTSTVINYYSPFIEKIRYKTLNLSRLYSSEVMIPYHIKKITLVDSDERILLEERLLIDNNSISNDEVIGYLFKEKWERFEKD